MKVATFLKGGDMSLPSMADETIAKGEPTFIRRRMDAAILAHAQLIGAKSDLDGPKVQSLTDDLAPLAVMPTTEPSKASSALDALVRYIPTEAVTLYVAAAAALPSMKSALGITEKELYWSFAMLTPVLFLLIYAGKRKGAKLPAFPAVKELPWWKVIACVIAFLVWALAIPSTPYLTTEGGKVVAGFGALLVSTFLTLIEPIVERQPSS